MGRPNLGLGSLPTGAMTNSEKQKRYREVLAERQRERAITLSTQIVDAVGQKQQLEFKVRQLEYVTSENEKELEETEKKCKELESKNRRLDQDTKRLKQENQTLKDDNKKLKEGLHEVKMDKIHLENELNEAAEYVRKLGQASRLDDKEKSKLTKFLGMLGSQYPNERELAAKQIEKIRKALDKSWDDIL